MKDHDIVYIVDVTVHYENNNFLEKHITKNVENTKR